MRTGMRMGTGMGWDKMEWDRENVPNPSCCWQDSKRDSLGDKMKEFMHKYDKNADGKIEMAEVRDVGRGRGCGAIAVMWDDDW